ncbi:MAG TPA: tetratricopeptide repeat protein, partial [Wenzhouxiangella sp.]
VGEPGAIERDETPADQLRGQLISIANELERDPDNQQNWMALGSAYKNIESFSSAQHAFRRALYLDPEDPAIQVELAETLIFANVGQTPQEAVALLDQALATDPLNQKALWLKGVIAFSDERFAEAIDQWENLLGALPADASVRTSIERQINLAKQQLGEAPTGRVIDLTLNIAPSIRESLSGDEAVFVIAQAMEGPPTPLAARRLVVDDLPLTLSLSDADAMIEGLTLSAFTEIVLTARISMSGDVAPSPGDFEGRVNVGPLTSATLVIDTPLD